MAHNSARCRNPRHPRRSPAPASSAALAALSLALAAAPVAAQPAPPSAAPSSSADEAARQVRAWEAMADALRPLAGRIAASAVTTDQGEAAADGNWMLMSAMGQFITNYRTQDTRYPQFTPMLNNVFNNGAPVPDYVYQIALIDGHGTYRLTGRRGTSRAVEFTVMNGFNGISFAGQNVGHFDLNDMHIARDGTFSILLGTQRPAGYTGDWVQLDPGAASLLVRHIAYDWKKEVDARIAIERLDVPARPAAQISPADIATRLGDLARFTGTRVTMWRDHIRRQREAGRVNTIEPFAFNGGVAGQQYLEGVFDIADDEALILETEVPKTCRYWGTLLTDTEFATFDWNQYQSSLNGSQARLDRDGKYRAVIATHDPGVPNWLDTAGRRTGIIQHRWNRCASQPKVSVRKVAFSQIRASLPADTPVVDAAARERSLRERREGAQLRPHW